MFEDQNKLDLLAATAAIDRIERSSKPVIVLFTAKWCSPCAAAEVVLCQLADEFCEAITMCAVDHDEAGNFAVALEVVRLPCVVVFDGGAEVGRITGLPAKQDLTAALTRLVADKHTT